MIRSLAFSLAAAGVALAAPCAATAQDQRDRPDADGDGVLTHVEARDHAEAGFGRLDANRDGLFDGQDRGASRIQRRERRFERTDANDDGMISRDEFADAGAALDARIARRRERRADRLTDDRALESGERPRYARRPSRRGGLLGLAGQADTDGNRVIDRDEYMAAADARFRRLDRDGDGAVTPAERQALRGMRRDR